MSGPLVTVGLSTYNRASGSGYLREALGSALAQTYRPLEILVSDNASTDRTPELVEEMTAGDDRVRFVRQEENLGANGNFNFCARAARGEYFLLLHDDDRLDPSMVELCMAALERRSDEERPGLIRTGTRVIDAEGAVLGERRNEARDGDVAAFVLDWFARRTSVYLCSTLFHAETLREVGGFASKHDLYQDVVAEVRVAARRGVLNVPDVAASFRRHGENVGGGAAIAAWTDDSRYLLEVMCEAAPGAADEIRRAGRPWLSSNNYTRIARTDDLGPLERLAAYWKVYQTFDFTLSPLRFFARRARRSGDGASATVR